MSNIPESQQPNPDLPPDFITTFWADNEGELWIIREFSDGTRVAEHPHPNDFAREFKAAQAAHQLDPDNATEEESTEYDEQRIKPDLGIILKKLREEKLARGEHIPPELELYEDDEGKIRRRLVIYQDNGEVSYQELED